MVFPRSVAVRSGVLRVAIHQPNYAPWLGYFHKMSHADLFVFLDDAQFSKGSYTNRVQVLSYAAPRWLTIPIRQSLGTPINEVVIARADWSCAHLEVLRNCYQQAPCFRDVWKNVEALYAELPLTSLAQVNVSLISRLAQRLGITTPMQLGSDLDIGACTGDTRLVRIVSTIAPGGTYLSGAGGANYQDVAKFEEAGLTLAYSQFSHPVYEQGAMPFVPGLSVLDAVFHMGWERTSALVAA